MVGGVRRLHSPRQPWLSVWRAPAASLVLIGTLCSVLAQQAAAECLSDPLDFTECTTVTVRLADNLYQDGFHLQVGRVFAQTGCCLVRGRRDRTV